VYDKFSPLVAFGKALRSIASGTAPFALLHQVNILPELSAFCNVTGIGMIESDLFSFYLIVTHI
jgi:hypothetical protein